MCNTRQASGDEVFRRVHELKFADRAIVPIEDPVECQIDGITQIKIDEFHHVDFPEAVKSVLRLDPDFLMPGEIRDAPSAHSAVNAAISGRVTLSTVHRRDAVGAVSALRAIGNCWITKLPKRSSWWLRSVWCESCVRIVGGK